MLCISNYYQIFQIVALGKKLPLYAFIVLKNSQTNVEVVLTDLIALCKNNKVCFYFIFCKRRTTLAGLK